MDALTKAITHPDLLMEVVSTGRYSLIATPEEEGSRAAVRAKERARKEAKGSTSRPRENDEC